MKKVYIKVLFFYSFNIYKNGSKNVSCKKKKEREKRKKNKDSNEGYEEGLILI